MGTVWFAWAVRDVGVVTHCRRIKGDRRDVRAQTVLYSLQGLIAEAEKLNVNHAT